MSITFGVIFVLGLLMGLPPAATDMYLPAMPAIATALNAGPEAVQQTLTLFLLFFAASQLFFGPLSDACGRKKVMLIGLLVFCLASVLSANASTIEGLIFYRGLQGVGGAAIIVTVPAVVRDCATGSEFSRVMGVIMLVMGSAPLIAPFLGSQILEFTGWRGIFAVLAVASFVVTILYMFNVGETLEIHRRSRFSIPNVLKNYRGALGDRQAVCYMFCSAFAVAAMFGFLAASPFVYILHYGVSEQQYSLLFGLNVMLMLVMTSVSNRFVARHGPRKMLGMAMVMILISCSLLAVISSLREPSLVLVTAAVMLFIGTAGVVNANAMALILSRLGHVSGSASALAGSFRFGLGAAAPLAVGLLYDGGVWAMAVVMLGCGVLSMFFYKLAARVSVAEPVIN
jgi:DHA1 family bicyclomycin/chloramphenicol resistance-like MFS transporter